MLFMFCRSRNMESLAFKTHYWRVHFRVTTLASFVNHQCSHSHIEVYGSLYSNIPTATKVQICPLHESTDSSIQLDYMNMQLLTKGCDCGLFSCAFSTAFCQISTNCYCNCYYHYLAFVCIQVKYLNTSTFNLTMKK